MEGLNSKKWETRGYHDVQNVHQEIDFKLSLISLFHKYSVVAIYKWNILQNPILYSRVSQQMDCLAFFNSFFSGWNFCF